MSLSENKSRHIPLRSCCACKTKRARSDLLRIVRLHASVYAIDIKQRLPGRGAYVCPTLACVTLLARTKGLNRSFRQVVPEQFYDSLLRFFSKTNNSG